MSGSALHGMHASPYAESIGLLGCSRAQPETLQVQSMSIWSQVWQV